MSVSIIIPNFNSLSLLEKNLPKVVNAAGQNDEIIVVDNLSTDGSREFLQNNYSNILLLNQNRVKGFASTVNLGVKSAANEIIVLLNTDIVPEKGFLSPLIKHFLDPKIFAVGCLEKSHEGGKIVFRGRGLAEFKNGMFIHKKGETGSTDTFWVSGGSGAFRKSMWEKLGGMDEIYNPFYYEDIDICYRAMKNGWKLVLEPESVVDHYHEEGAIKKYYSQGQIKTIAYRNQLLFIWKNITDSNLQKNHFKNLPLIALKSLVRGDIYFIAGMISAVFRKNRIVIKHNSGCLFDSDIFERFKDEV